MTQTLIHITAGLLGSLLMMLIRMRRLQDKFYNNNQEFVFKKFFKNDATSIMISVFTVLSFVLIFPELVKYKPHFENWVRTLFTAVGMSAEYLIGKFHSSTRKYIDKIIKTNEEE